MNSLFVIAPYKSMGMWVFDDERVGLVREPFVAGADTMIDRLVAGMDDPDSGFRMIFAATPFPGFAARLDWVRPEYGGNIYRWEDQRMEGWLCPALFHYFPEAPKQIYVRAEPRITDAKSVRGLAADLRARGATGVVCPGSGTVIQ